jgi:hypothetical protein
LTIANSGAAVWPSIAWAAQQIHDLNDRFALRTLIAAYAFNLSVLFFFNVHPTLRHWVDPIQKTLPAE